MLLHVDVQKAVNKISDIFADIYNWGVRKI